MVFREACFVDTYVVVVSFYYGMTREINEGITTGVMKKTNNKIRLSHILLRSKVNYNLCSSYDFIGLSLIRLKKMLFLISCMHIPINFFQLITSD